MKSPIGSNWFNKLFSTYRFGNNNSFLSSWWKKWYPKLPRTTAIIFSSPWKQYWSKSKSFLASWWIKLGRLPQASISSPSTSVGNPWSFLGNSCLWFSSKMMSSGDWWNGGTESMMMKCYWTWLMRVQSDFCSWGWCFCWYFPTYIVRLHHLQFTILVDMFCCTGSLSHPILVANLVCLPNPQRKMPKILVQNSVT